MSKKVFFGFFLGNETDENSTKLYKLACYEAKSDFRKVLSLRSEDDSFEASYGEIVRIETESQQLVDSTLCCFIKIDPPYIYDAVDGVIMHTMEKFDVSVDNCIGSGEFQHPEVGLMADNSRLLYPGKYHKIMFQVEIEDDTFRLDVLGAIRADDAKMSMTQKVEDMTERLEQIGTLLKIETDYIEEQETKNWKEVGALKLIRLDDLEFLEGDRMVFEIVDMRKLELFKKISDSSIVTVHRAVQNEETGEWEDDLVNPITEELKGNIRMVDGRENRCIVSLVRAARTIVDQHVEKGQLFLFKCSQPGRSSEYWKKGKHDRNEALLHVIEGGDSQLGLHNCIEDHMSDADEIKNLKDGGVQNGVLNPTQAKAIMMARNEKRKLVCIQGPPGTGKTHVLAHYLMLHVREGKKAVVLAPTREAIANIKRKVKEVLKEKKLDKELHEHALMDLQNFQDIVNSSDEAKRAKELTDDWKKLVKSGNISPNDFAKLRTKAADRAKNSAMKKVVGDVKIVFATVASSFVEVMLRSKFLPDVCVIDEAGQVTEGATWPACNTMKRVVLAGDPMQLPAVIFSTEGKEHQLERSVMDRIMENKDRFSWIMLDKQYRCNELICSWSSRHFYDNKLVTAPTIKRDMSVFFFNSSLEPKRNALYSMAQKVYAPLVMFDTSFIQDENLRIATYENALFATDDANRGYSELTYSNDAEAEIVIDHFNRLVEKGVQPEKIAVITPYRGQYDLMWKLVVERNLKIKNIGTVDSFQGQEYDIVIFSMVRNNPQCQLGFVSDLRRLNVAITRAKYHFALVGSGYMLYENKENGKKEQLKDLISYFQRTGHRFPPKFARGEITACNSQATPVNNFGMHFEAFKKFTKDTKMLEYIKKYEVNKGLIKAEDDS